MSISRVYGAMKLLRLNDRVLEVDRNAKLNFAMTSMVLPLLYAFKISAFREEKE